MRNLMFALLAFLCAMPMCAQKKYKDIVPDTAKVHYIHRKSMEDAYIFDSNLRKNTVYVNEQVTTHIIMPENIKLVDISTDAIIGNQCADNIVRIKPAGRMYDYELAGTMTVIGERHIAKFNIVYVKGPAHANSIYNIDLQIGDYFFIDFSLYNNTKIKFDIDEIRVKLTDKKESKATNTQTIELTPVYTLNKASSFKKGYRNVIVLKKLTFPDEKILNLEISENQISGRVIYIPIEYSDILHADGFDESLMKSISRQ